MVKEKIKIIIDTDNGDDIDDLITFYFALENKNIEIVGIICSYLNAPLRVKQVEHVLKLFGREDIPVLCGRSKPLATLHPNSIETIYCQYTDELGVADTIENGDKAVDFLIENAAKLGQNLTILEIAPETTLAAAISKNRDAFKDTNIVLMAGAFYKNVNEWNIECDYESARIILESKLHLTYVGLDVTDLTELVNPKYENLLLQHYDSKLGYLSKCSNMWVNVSKRHIVLHDPLTLLTLVHDDLCVFEDKYVKLIPNEDKTRYYTRITDNENDTLIKVAKTLDLNKLLDEIFVPVLRRLDTNE